MRNKFYTYSHSLTKNGEPFYIGEAMSPYRLDDTKRRNKAWKKLVKENNGNFYPKVLKRFKFRINSYKHEERLIDDIGLQNLVNVLPGGNPKGKRVRSAKAVLMAEQQQDPQFIKAMVKNGKSAWEKIKADPIKKAKHDAQVNKMHYDKRSKGINKILDFGSINKYSKSGVYISTFKDIYLAANDDYKTAKKIYQVCIGKKACTGGYQYKKATSGKGNIEPIIKFSTHKEEIITYGKKL